MLKQAIARVVTEADEDASTSDDDDELEDVDHRPSRTTRAADRAGCDPSAARRRTTTGAGAAKRHPSN